MDIFGTILKWMGKAFSFADYIISIYNEIKSRLPGLVAMIETLYRQYRPRVVDPNDSLDGPDAADLLVNSVAVEFTSSPITIPKAFIKYVLEVVHMHENLDVVSYYDSKIMRNKANKVLRGLHNKYGDR